MNNILDIIGFIFYLTVFGVFLNGLTYYIHFIRYSNHKYDIEIRQAALINYRKKIKMILKAKISNLLNHYHQIPHLGSNPEVEEAFEKLSHLQYEFGNDFQQYFDFYKVVNGFVHQSEAHNNELHKVGYNSSDTFSLNSLFKGQQVDLRVVEELLGPDFINDIPLLYSIKEMAELTTELNHQIDLYNYRHSNIKRRASFFKLENLNFPALSKINRAFSHQDIFQSSDAQNSSNPIIAAS